MPSSAYTAEQYRRNFPDGYENHYWPLARNMIVARRLRAFFDPGDVLLDVGCGRGIVLAYLRARGWDCHGCDISTPPLLPGCEPFVTVAAQAVDLPKEARERTNGLLFCDLIEHLEDPAHVLGACRDTFPRLRRVLATVPARRELWSNYDECYGHYKRYDLAATRSLFEDAGYTVLHLAYFFHAIYLPMRLLLAWKGARCERMKAPKRPALHALLARCFSLEERLVPGCWFGGSIIAVAEPATDGGVGGQPRTAESTP